MYNKKKDLYVRSWLLCHDLSFLLDLEEYKDQKYI